MNAPLGSPDLASLDRQQRRAVLSEDPAVVVEAQVGSGKTTVLVHKLLWLHREQGVPLDRIAVLTFTRRAASELRSRLADLDLPVDSWHLLGTFHGVARALLTHDLPVDQIGYPGGFQVLDARRRDELWERLIVEHGLEIKYRRRLARRWEAWQRGQGLFGNMKNHDDMTRLAELYEAAKRDRGVMDFDDLLEHASALLPTATPPRWILIDELQDCSEDQLRFVERLAGPETRWFAVGDPDQVIYSWRGGSAKLFRSFGRRRRATTLDLSANYRSTATIVDGAQAFLRRRRLVATRPGGEPIVVLGHHDAHSEGIYLGRRLRQLHDEGCAWTDLAILVRTTRQLDPLADALRRANVPVGLTSGVQGAAIPWVRALLRAGLDDDPLLASVALGHPEFGSVTPKKLQRARALAQEKGWTGLAGLQRVFAGQLARSKGGPRWRSMLRGAQNACARLSELRAWLDVHQDEDWAPRLLEFLEISLALGPTRSNYARDVASVSAWLQALREQVLAAKAPAASEEGALARRLRAAVEAPVEVRPQAKTGVQLMTLHASKGLEFRWVFLSGANEGLLPLSMSKLDPASRREERRLFFVGLTRAKDGVEISWLRSPGRPDVEPEPSSFLAQLPDSCVAWLDREALAKRTEMGAASAEWTLGDRVRHRKYGSGEVVGVGTKIRVAFGHFGEKPFTAGALCPLVRE